MFKKYNEFLINVSSKLSKIKQLLIILAIAFQFINIGESPLGSLFTKIGIVLIILSLIAWKKEFENIAGKYAVAVILLTYIVIYSASVVYSAFW